MTPPSSVIQGPKVEGCVVDAESEGYQCVEYPEKERFIPFSMGQDLECMSPADLENMLLSCRRKTVDLTLCAVNYEADLFSCIDPHNEEFEISLEDADNFFCMSPGHLQRVTDRCSVPYPTFNRGMRPPSRDLESEYTQ